MGRPTILLIVFILSAACVTVGQTTTSTEPAPTPKPAVKRRTFDQFDLSNGIRVATSESASTEYGADKSGVVEFVDERTYDGVRRLVEYVREMDAEYRYAATSKPNDWVPLSTLNRKLNATYKITEMFREGLLDQKPLKDPMNILLLEESQITLREALSTVAISGGWSKNESMLGRMAVKYNAEQAFGIENIRRAVVFAMLGRLNTNLGQLLGQIAVNKQ